MNKDNFKNEEKLEEQLPQEQEEVQELKEYKFSNIASEITFLRTYSKMKSNGDKETWKETITRYFNYLRSRFEDKLDPEILDKAFRFVLEGKVMPSMRLLQYAGEVIDKFEATVYNCSYVDIDSIDSLSEMLYLNLIGVGVGFGLNKICTDKLPIISIQKNMPKIKVVFKDSTEGWVKGYRLCLTLWYAGYDTDIDVSNVRKKGSKIANRGHSAGQESLQCLLDKCRSKILDAQGRKLKPIELYDILCYSSYHVSASGPRRVAAISFSDHDDLEMRNAKKGEFWIDNPQRTVCNNSIRYYTSPTEEEFWADWEALKNSGTGERGIFNISQFLEEDAQCNRRRWPKGSFPGANACGEIKLRSCQFCNLSEIIVRETDTLSDLLEKTQIATLIGTWQSLFIDFDPEMLRPEWRKNCEEERLLGVSLTGVLDNELFQNEDISSILELLKKKAIEVNLEESKRLGINQSAAITCCKPSGTVSLVMNTASGIHARFAKYYIRRIRFSKFDQMLKKMEGLGIPIYEAPENSDQSYIEIPIKAPEGSITINELSAIEQMEIWKKFKMHYTEHNPSFTCQVEDKEWDLLGEWVYNNLNQIVGVSFLPKAHLYLAAPIEEINKDRFKAMFEKYNNIDISSLYSNEDAFDLLIGCDKSTY